MKIEHKTIQMEQTRCVYIAEDGMEFSTERDCLSHELSVRQEELNKRKDIIRCKEAEDLSPFNGAENYEHHKYLWYKPETAEAVDALVDTYPPTWGTIDASCIGRWCCVEISDGDYWWTSIEDDMKYVKNLCRLLGIEVEFKEETK